MLDPHNVFNHCCLLTDADWRILADAGVNVTANPRSDALFGLEAGGFPYSTALEHGIRPALGIDIDTAQSGDMFGEMRAAFHLQRSIAQTRRASGDTSAPAPVTVREILEASTIAGARVLGLDDKVGSLTPGKQADIIMIRADGVGVFPSHNAIGNVVHMAQRTDVRTAMVAGRILKHEGALVGVDLAAVRSAAEEFAGVHLPNGWLCPPSHRRPLSRAEARGLILPSLSRHWCASGGEPDFWNTSDERRVWPQRPITKPK